jgi:arabinose-5-phosphate isomerase
MGNPIIAMTANKDAFLGRHADYLLHTPCPMEADPNNLAPTASTIAQAALGDALATALLALRGFSPSHFARFHPGGALGKQLYLRMRDIYPNNERPSVGLDDTIHQVILEITSKRLGAAAVTDDSGALRGIITDGDLRRMLEKQLDINVARAKDVMTVAPKTIDPDALAVKALEIIRRHSITQIVVVDERNHYLGMVHLHDLVREGLL